VTKLALASCVLLGCLGTAAAQLLPSNAEGITMGHVHLNVRSVEAHRSFWIDQIGAKPVKMGKLEGVAVPGLILLFRQKEPAGPVTGEVINHMGLKVRRLSDLMAVFEKFGSRTEGVRIGRENTPQTYVVAPDDFRIELVEDPSLSAPVVSHHLHYFLADPIATKKWYVDNFLLKSTMRGPYESGELPGISLTFAPLPKNAPPGALPTVATRGRSLDHIGFEVKNLEALCRRLEAKGIKFDTPYRHFPELQLGIAFLTDPWGTTIELTEGLGRMQ
jgi:catechol 2,3-dioxygenase-like lactoylglutathione lyase family enzyme